MLHLTLREESRLSQVILFGSGTIGGEIARSLLGLGATVAGGQDIAWDDPAARRAQIASLPMTELAASRAHIHLIWAAGALRFSATAGQAEATLASFEEILRLAERAEARADAVTLHVMSSAGGLFEGRHVGLPDEVPNPRRPYGHLKLEEERLARSLGTDVQVEIYRPSSVYIHPAQVRNPGLVGTLVSNGMEGRSSRIIGALDTLRDYVHARDIGRFVAARIRRPRVGLAPETSMLVLGQPASIARVIHGVEQTLRRRLLLEIREAWNASDITFAPAVRAPGFRPMALSEGVVTTFTALRQHLHTPVGALAWGL